MKLRLLVTLSLLTASLKSMEMVKTTPLHEAAKSKDINKCAELLVQPTWLTEAMIQKGQFPSEAAATLQTSKNPLENVEIMRKLSLFAIMSNKFMQHQLAIAKLQLTTLDEELLTPYDCAAKAQAPRELLVMLDTASQNQELTNKIMAIIAEKLGATGKVGFATGPVPAQRAANPRGPLFMPGQTIDINGQGFTCTEVRKLAETHETE